MNDGYLSNPDEIHEGLWVDDDVDKWVKIARALKEADKTDCFYYQQAEKIVGKEKLGSCSMDEFRMAGTELGLDLREGLGSMDLDNLSRAFRRTS